MKSLSEQIAEVLEDPELEDASDKLEAICTLAHNSSRRCTPAEEKDIWRDLCDSAGVDPDLPPSQPVKAVAVTPLVDYQRIEDIMHTALRAQRQPLRVDSAELCGLLHISERTLERWISNHIIPYEQVPTSEKSDRGKLLFDVASVDKALKRWRRNAIGD